MFTVSEKLYQQMPTEIKDLFDKLPNYGSDEVEAVFPQNIKGEIGRANRKPSDKNSAIWGNAKAQVTEHGLKDSGSASRFFYKVKLDEREVDGSDYKGIMENSRNWSSSRAGRTPVLSDDTQPRNNTSNEANPERQDRPDVSSTIQGQRLKYTAKASKNERNAGLEGFEPQFAPKGNNEGRDMSNPKNHMGGMQGSKMQNHHPTVKPLSLTKYLATLIKPPTGGRLLVPFSGSGSEMIGALQAGWEYVEGVELTEEYIPIAEARIKYWQNISQTSSKPKVSAKKHELVQQEAESLTLF